MKSTNGEIEELTRNTLRRMGIPVMVNLTAIMAQTRATSEEMTKLAERCQNQTITLKSVIEKKSDVNPASRKYKLKKIK